MLYSTSLSVLLGVCSVSASPIQEAAFKVPTDSLGRCGTVPNATQVLDLEKDFNNEFLANPLSELQPAAETQGIKTINVYFHVVSSKSGTGSVPNSQITAQIDTLNSAYQGFGFQWSLAGISRSANSSWFSDAAPGSQQQTDMKKVLRQGGANALNIYSVGFDSVPGLLGYSSFPATYKQKPYEDGIVVKYTTLPGGTTSLYNLGMTSVHETGHWLGLYHTFQGGCDGLGDYVSDTAPEGSGASGCPSGRRTCPKSGQVDPIHNYMDYSVDSCMNQFTSGQIERAKSQIRVYRGLNVA